MENSITRITLFSICLYFLYKHIENINLFNEILHSIHIRIILILE
jgi:hypothetical protein